MNKAAATDNSCNELNMNSASPQALDEHAEDHKVEVENNNNGTETENASAENASEHNLDLVKCTLCNAVFNAPHAAEMHYAGKRHAKKRKWIEMNEGTQNQKPSLPSSPACTSNNEVEKDLTHCTVCDARFTGQFQAEQHYTGKKHARKLNLSLKPPIQTEFCNLCKISMLGKEQAESHFKGKKHQKALEKVNLKPNEAGPAKPEVSKIPHIFEILKALITPPPMLPRNVPMSLDSMVNKKLFSKRECVACQKTFNGDAPIKDHVSSKKHIGKLDEIQLFLEQNCNVDPSHRNNMFRHVLKVLEECSVDGNLEMISSQYDVQDILKSIVDNVSEKQAVEPMLSIPDENSGVAEVCQKQKEDVLNTTPEVSKQQSAELSNSAYEETQSKRLHIAEYNKGDVISRMENDEDSRANSLRNRRGRARRPMFGHPVARRGRRQY